MDLSLIFQHKLIISLLAGALSIAYAIFLSLRVLSKERGDSKMNGISNAIEEGAIAYMKRQYAVVAAIGVVIAIILYFVFGAITAAGFILGAIFSAIAGVVGMSIAVRSNIRTAQAAKNLGVKVVNGFTGSSIWHLLYSFPPVSPAMIDDGFGFFANMWNPILDEFKSCSVKFALEVHPTEIAFDIATAERALAALKHRPEFGFNYDPSHLGYQHVDYVTFIRRFPDRIYHTHMKDAWWGHGDGTVGVFGGHTAFADPRRYWDFRSLGRGDIRFEDIIVALNDIGYTGPLSVEWEDSRMDREHGATESCAFVRKLDFKSSSRAFDAAFER